MSEFLPHLFMFGVLTILVIIGLRFPQKRQQLSPFVIVALIGYLAWLKYLDGTLIIRTERIMHDECTRAGHSEVWCKKNQHCESEHRP